MALSRVSRPWSRGRGRPCRTELQQSRVRSTWRDPQRRESGSLLWSGERKQGGDHGPVPEEGVA